MNQNLNGQELIRFLKKGELTRNNTEKNALLDNLSAVENAILSESFEFDITKGDEYFYSTNLCHKLILRKLNDNIRRIYKDEQGNRNFIIQQVKTLLKENAPFWIIKTDIKSFYQSIDRKKILSKLKNDAILSYHSIYLLDKVMNNATVNTTTGLPKGINISSTLSEIYLRKFDNIIQRFENVYYYARFVDDIIVFINSNQSANNLFHSIDEILFNTCTLNINKNKTSLIEGATLKYIFQSGQKSKKNNIEYLGYNFSIQSNSKERNIIISIAEKKIKKIKMRLIKSYLEYIKTSNFEMLIKRVKFLTGNYRVSESTNDSILKAGIFYNYIHINSLTALQELNVFHRKVIFSKNGNLGIKLNTALSADEKKILKRFCFTSGYKMKVYNNFSYLEMNSITNCWK